MIPKIIHYCWLSEEPFPKDISKYIQTWKKILPDYELRLWNLNTDNIGENLWVRQSFEAKKYAFAADYIRIFALYKYGGIYLDTDVEVIKTFNDLLHLPYFAGTEGGKWIEAAVLGSERDAVWLKEILTYFDKPFVNSDGSFAMITLPQVMNTIIENKKLIVVADKSEIFENINKKFDTNFYLFEEDFFSPKNMGTGIISKTPRTYTIHHFAMSWISFNEKLLPNIKRSMMKIFGVKRVAFFLNFFRLNNN